MIASTVTDLFKLQGQSHLQEGKPCGKKRECSFLHLMFCKMTWDVEPVLQMTLSALFLMKPTKHWGIMHTARWVLFFH